MKTGDLIAALSQDGQVERGAAGRAVALLLPLAALAAAGVFYAVFGLRPDLYGALAATATKLAISLALAATALAAALRLSRPGAKAPFVWLAAPLAVLLLALAGDLGAHGLVDWRVRLFGQTSAACVTLVIALSIAPLIALIAALRHGAPTRPTLTGLLAGLAAAGVGASVYALHCPEDSPLFFAAWYGTAALLTALAGAICGRLLRW